MFQSSVFITLSVGRDFKVQYFIVLPIGRSSKSKVYSSANMQKFQSLKFIVLPIGRSFKVYSSQFCQQAEVSKSKVYSSANRQKFQSVALIALLVHRCFKVQRFIRIVLSNVPPFINCVTVPQFYQQVENLKLTYILHFRQQACRDSTNHMTQYMFHHMVIVSCCGKEIYF